MTFLTLIFYHFILFYFFHFSGVYFKWISLDQIFLSSEGKLILGGLSGATYALNSVHAEKEEEKEKEKKRDRTGVYILICVCDECNSGCYDLSIL